MLQGMETAEQSYIFIPSIKKCQHMDSRLNALQACNGIVLWFAQWVILRIFIHAQSKTSKIEFKVVSELSRMFQNDVPEWTRIFIFKKKFAVSKTFCTFLDLNKFSVCFDVQE